MALTNRPIRRALVSVFHKEGLETLAKAFASAGTQVVSTGSTAKALAAQGVHVIQVSDVTGFPESLGGRVKTLDPHIHAGILADLTNPEQSAELERLGITPFDLVVVNLYPFADTVRQGASPGEIIEKIDVGGPSMIRAAAKNSASVAVITDEKDYALAAERVGNQTGFTLEERRWLAAKAFALTAAYDATISDWVGAHWSKPSGISESTGVSRVMRGDGDNIVLEQSQTTSDAAVFQATLTRTWDRSHVLRYGENPHQNAALYVDPLNQTGFAHAQQLGGKPMSYNNYVDADAAWRTVWDYAPQVAVAIIKHNNPCGLAIGSNVAEAHEKAHACDPKSAYGGVIAANTIITLQMAQQVRPIFTEVIVAPDYEPEALKLLQTKKKNLRILKVIAPPNAKMQIRAIDGGLLAQSMDLIDAPGDNPEAWTLVSGQDADTSTMADLAFAWRAVRCVKSNAILLAHDRATVGIGMGQVNRVDSCNLAIARANTLADGVNRASGSVAASDAFFPFADGAQTLIDAGVRAIVQPGGSIRDDEVFDAARQAGITMYVTGTRHFFH